MNFDQRRQIQLSLMFVRIIVAVVAFTVGATAASGQDTRDSRRLADQLTRRDRGEGGVSIAVLLLTPEYVRVARPAVSGRYNPEGNLAFTVTFDTHAGDIGGLDMIKLVRLRDAQGREQAPARWEDTARSAHHVSGLLVFPLLGPDGKTVLSDDGGVVEVVIREVAKVKERVFRWELPIRSL